MPTTEDLAPRQRRALILRSLLRALVTTTLLVALYYVLPMDSAPNAHTVLLLVLCLVLLAAVLTWRLRGITRKQDPGKRALEERAGVEPKEIREVAAT